MTIREFLINKGFYEIIFKKLPTGHLLLSASVNGIDGSFILDTGTGYTFVRAELKEKFGLKVHKEMDCAAGAGGDHLRTAISGGNKLVIAEFHLNDHDIYLMNLDHVNLGFRERGISEIDGIIGGDILTPGEGIIDYKNHALFLKGK